MAKLKATARKQVTQRQQNQHLTDAVIRRLLTPDQGNRITYDDEVAGFGARVTAAGNRSFILNYMVRKSGAERRYTIGSCSDWSTTAARAKARDLRRDIDDGGDPLADIEDARAAPTVDELADRFEQEHLPRKRPSTARDYKHMLAIHIRPALGRLKVAEVSFSDVDALHRKITTKRGSPYQANRVVAVLAKMFSLSIRWGMRADNPAKGIERNLEHHRRRYLSGDELARLTKALAEHPDKQAADIVRLLMLTGCRRGEALSARWSDIDLAEGAWSKPASSTKQKTDHQVPLSAPARQLLSAIREQQAGKRQVLGEFVFPSPSSKTGHVVDVKKSWAAICKAAGITELRVHDLRHSFASQLVSGGASLPLIGALLGHASPSTTQRYAHLHTDPMREATERVGAVIVAAGKPAPEPIPFKRR